MSLLFGFTSRPGINARKCCSVWGQTCADAELMCNKTAAAIIAVALKALDIIIVVSP
jgi:hypothetical protein